MSDTTRSRRGRPASGAELDRTGVLSAALALIDERGLQALTMRSLAEVLTVTPSALYWHFPTKEQLIGEVSALVLADIEVSDDHEQAWDVWLAALAHGMRAAMHRHPNLASVVGGQMLTTERGVPLAERIFRVLAAAGFSGRELIDVFNTYVGAVLGWSTMELSAQPDAGDGWQEDLARRFDEVDAMSYPTLARVMPLARDNAFMLRWSSGTVHPLDSSFAVLLDTLLHGLRARLTAR